MSVNKCNGCLGPISTVLDNYITTSCSVPTSDPNTVTISYPDNYTGNIEDINPIPSKITIQNTIDGWILTMGDNPFIKFTVNLDNSITFNTDAQGFAVGIPTELPTLICGQSVTLNRIRITGTALLDIPKLFLINSSYVIDIGRTPANLLLASITVSLPKRGSFSSDVIIEAPVTNPKDRIMVPILLISGQTLFDGTDLSDFKFTIQDEFTYYKEHPLCNSKCGIFCVKPCELKTTIFRKCCSDTSLCCVLKGEGRNAYEKALYLYNNDLSLKATTTFNKFYYSNLILYAMSKYILSRILYGEFDIKFLLTKYNNAFFINLGQSRFCGALRIYNDPNDLASYDRFFLFDYNSS